MKRLSPAGHVSFLVLLVSQIAATVGFTFVMPFMPLYVQQLGVESAGDAAAWAGVLNGSAGVTMALTAPLWGLLADRWGRKLMLLRATLAGSVVLCLMGLVTDPWQLLGLRLLQGTLTGTVPAATVLVSSAAPPDRAGSRLGTLQMVIFVAAAAGPFLGGLFADLVGIRASFFVTAALLAVSGVMVLLGVREPRREGEESLEGTADRGPLPYRSLLPGLLALFVVHVGMTSVVPALPGFLSTLEGSGERLATQTGQIIGAGALAAAVGSVLCGRLANRFRERRVICWALLLAGLTAVPQAAASTVPELWVLRVASSLFLGGLVPVANLAIRSAVPEEKQGAAFGVASSAVAVGFALGPIGGGLLASTLGFWSSFLAPGLMLLLLAAVLFVMPEAGGKSQILQTRRVWRTIMAHLLNR